MTGTPSSPGTHSGRFWRPDNEGNVVSGRLTLAQSASPRLELDEPLTPLFRELEPPAQPEGVRVFELADEGPELTFFTVHGRLDDGTLVTLADASERRRKVGGGRDRQWLKAQLALLGGHVDGREGLYTQVRLRLRHLDDWAALPGFTLERAPDDGQGRVALAFDTTDTPPVSLQDGSELSLEQTAEVTFSPFHGGRIDRTVWLRVIGLQPATIDDIDRRIVTPLSTLLTLATGTPCPPVAVEIATGPDGPWLAVEHSGLEAPADKARAPDRQLLPLATLGLDGVAAWLGTVDRLGPLPPVVAAAVAGSRGTLETQLLDLTTVAEGLHRVLFPDARRLSDEQADKARRAVGASLSDLEDEVRTAVERAMQHLEEVSFPRRLQQLADYVGDAMPGVTGRTNRWKQYVTRVRNEFAHRDYGFLANARIPDLVSVLASLRWLLTGLLLLQTGVAPEALATRLEGHQPYTLFRQQARARLPRVYAEPSGGETSSGE